MLNLVLRDHPDPDAGKGRLRGEPSPSVVEVVKTPLDVAHPSPDPAVIFRASNHASRYGDYTADAVVDEADGRVYLVQSGQHGFSLLSFAGDAEPVGLDGTIRLIRPIPAGATAKERDEIRLASLMRYHATPLGDVPAARFAHPITRLDLYMGEEGPTVIATVQYATSKTRRLQFDYSLARHRWTREDPMGEVKDSFPDLKSFGPDGVLKGS